MSVESAVATPLNPTGRDIELHASLRLGARDVGTVLLRIEADDSLSLDADGIRVLLADYISPELLSPLAELAVGGRLTPMMFERAGLALHFDPGTFELSLEITRQQLLRSVVSLRPRTETVVYRPPASVSGYINLFAGITHRQIKTAEGKEAQTSQSHQLEAILRAYNTVLELRSRFERKEQDDSGHFYRDGIKLIYDFSDASTRLTAGDFRNAGGALQDSVDILGVSLNRDFQVIPTRNIKPTAGRQFYLARSADVDVLIGGVLMQRLSLPSGSYDLQDIPLTSGRNDIELVIRDDAGVVERLAFSVLTGQSLLAEGEFDYEVAAGIAARRGAGHIDYDKQAVLASARARYGLAPWLTVGASIQGRQEARQLGGELLMATEFGTLEFSAAASRVKQLGSGYAVMLGFDSFIVQGSALESRLALRGEYLSANFGGIAVTGVPAPVASSGPAIINDVAGRATLSYSQRLGDSLRGSVGVGYSRRRGPKERRFSLSAGLSGRLGSTPATWNVQLSAQRSDRQDDEFDAFFNISWPLSRQARLQGSYELPSGTSSLRYRYAKNTGRSGGVTAYLETSREPHQELGIEGGVDYLANRFRMALEHDNRRSELDNDWRSDNSKLRFETSLAFADGQVALGRTVGDSFAIVSRHPSLDDSPVRIGPDRWGELVRSDGLGPLLVPELGSYLSRTLNYDIDNLPLGYDLGDGLFTLAPPYGAGYSLQIGSDATITLVGKLLDEATGEPLGLVAGEAVLLVAPEQPPIQFFSNRKGRFAVTGMRPGRYELHLTTTPKRIYQLTVEQDESAFVDVGELRVK